jgi:decaprenylphospho-beta-D-ribofuranose 2-oxidase
VPALLAEIPDSIVPRGGGTSYGDAALNDGRAALDLRRLDRILALDEAGRTITCESGVALRDIVTVALSRGLFLPVTPGTWKSTVGGCIACDVHGKNHHVAGSFADHVTRIRLALADGRVVECSRDTDPDLFWATAGGLGLTGIILDATIRLLPVESSWIRVRYVKSGDLDATFAALEKDEPEPYSVAWFDVLARGRHLGRSVLMLGDHARADELPGRARAAPLSWAPGRSFRLPFAAPSGAMSAPVVRAFNAVYFSRFPDDTAPRLQPLRPFFYPLEAIDNFNLLYGRRGLVEYQCVLPSRAAHRVLQTMVERLAAAGFGSFLCVLKRMGARNASPLSFPAEGYTIAVDIPFRGEPLLALLREFDELVARDGGRVYLAKDSRLEPQFVDAMYPARRAWANTLDAIDPRRLVDSSLARRLRLRAT